MPYPIWFSAKTFASSLSFLLIYYTFVRSYSPLNIVKKVTPQHTPMDDERMIIEQTNE